MSDSIFNSPDQATEIDQRLAGSDQDALVNAFGALSLRSNDLPLRPGWGAAGTPVKLRSNFFAVRVPKGPLCEYDIKIAPAASVNRVKRRIFELLERETDWARYKVGVAHDSSTKLIACRRLPQPLRFDITYYDDDEEGPRDNAKVYNVEFIFVQDIDMSSLTSYLSGDPAYREIDIGPILSALNIVLAQHPSRNGVMVGRNRFFFPQETFSLGGGLEAWKGFYSSVRPAYKQLMVNVNVATTAFYSEGNLANAMMEFRRVTPGARVDSFVRGIRIQTTHLGHKKTVKRASHHNAQTHSFFWEEKNRQVTVEQYFRLSECFHDNVIANNLTLLNRVRNYPSIS